ncbi:MAG: hypothetical protein QXJ06_04550 [Candidatus Aenigmatarchaeota archaeon]
MSQDDYSIIEQILESYIERICFWGGNSYPQGYNIGVRNMLYAFSEKPQGELDRIIHYINNRLKSLGMDKIARELEFQKVKIYRQNYEFLLLLSGLFSIASFFNVFYLASALISLYIFISQKKTITTILRKKFLFIQEILLTH